MRYILISFWYFIDKSWPNKYTNIVEQNNSGQQIAIGM